LEEFRKRILPYLKIIREENGLVFKSNMLQKHRWSKFLQENSDTKAFWEDLPRTKSNHHSSLEKIQEIKAEEMSFTIESHDFEEFSPCMNEPNMKIEHIVNKEETASIMEFPEFKMPEDFSYYHNEFDINFEEVNTCGFGEQKNLKEEKNERLNPLKKINEEEGNFEDDFINQVLVSTQDSEKNEGNEEFMGGFLKEWEERSFKVKDLSRFNTNNKLSFSSWN